VAGEVTAGLAKSIAATARFMACFGHLPADCRGPGSAPERCARFEYGTTYIRKSIFVAMDHFP